MIGEGTPANPYRENPPTHFVEVHWAGGIAVKWNYAQFLYQNGALPVPNAPAGTLSVWLKFHPDSVTKAGQAMSLFFSGWVQLDVSTRDDWSTVVHGGAAWGMTDVIRAFHKFRFFPSNAPAHFNGPANTYAYLMDTGDAFRMTSPPVWFHVFAQWETNGGSLALTVNGVPLATRMYPGDYVNPNELGPPFDVSWSYAIDASERDNSSQFFSNTDYYGLPVGFSIAEFWLDIGNPLATPPTVAKFVDVKTGRPVPLGKDGEVPTGQKPAFYFARSGAPQTFVRNRGYGGDFTFARGNVDGSFVDLPDPAADPPLDEPDNPHFTPIPAAAAA